MLDVVILTDTSALARDAYDALLPLVSPEKLERINRIRFFQNAQNILLVDVLARAEINRVTSLSNKELIFSVNAHGKPFLINDPRIHYNVSHSGHYAACAISDEPVGIDIELIRPVNLKIADRFFAPDETAYIAGNPLPHRFFEVWTKKESRIKWEGKGLSKSLPSFSVFDFDETNMLYYHQVFHNDEAICHVCSPISEKPTIRIMDIAAFIEICFRL